MKCEMRVPRTPAASVKVPLPRRTGALHPDIVYSRADKWILGPSMTSVNRLPHSSLPLVKQIVTATPRLPKDKEYFGSVPHTLQPGGPFHPSYRPGSALRQPLS